MNRNKNRITKDKNTSFDLKVVRGIAMTTVIVFVWSANYNKGL